MNKDDINEEIKMCNGILEKFKEEMADCKNDYETLKNLKEEEEENPNFKKALAAVKQRHDDIALSVKLIKGRIDKLNEDLKSIEE